MPTKVSTLKPLQNVDTKNSGNIIIVMIIASNSLCQNLSCFLLRSKLRTYAVLFTQLIVNFLCIRTWTDSIHVTSQQILNVLLYISVHPKASSKHHNYQYDISAQLWDFPTQMYQNNDLFVPPEYNIMLTSV